MWHELGRFLSGKDFKTSREHCSEILPCPKGILISQLGFNCKILTTGNFGLIQSFGSSKLQLTCFLLAESFESSRNIFLISKISYVHNVINNCVSKIGSKSLVKANVLIDIHAKLFLLFLVPLDYCPLSSASMDLGV